MTKSFMSLTLITLLAGCVSVRNGSPDHVNLRHGAAASFGDIEEEATKYCAQYGKRAVLKTRFDSNNTVFDCK